MRGHVVAPAPERALSIVIATNDRDARKLVAQVARQAVPSASFRFASTGRAVTELVVAEVPDVLLLDAKLPQTDIVALCAQLRTIVTRSPLTICATRSSGEHEGELANLGVETIPINASRPRAELVSSLRGMLTRRPRATVPPPEPMTPVVSTTSAPPHPTRSLRRSTQPFAATLRSPATSGVPAGEPDRVRSIEIGTTIDGRYVVEDRIGAGGMGTVFAARHVDLGKRFALKVPFSGHARNAAASKAFLDEARIASAISHPNVVSVVDFGTDPTHGVFMVMELLSGETLAKAINRLSIKRACETLGQIADAVDVLHRSGVIHGDIKADNVMILEEQQGRRRRSVARLIDFGLSHELTGAPEHEVSGTPEYMAPERVRGEPASVATDIYALGILAYELVTGKVPFEGTVAAVLVAQAEQALPPMTTRDARSVEAALEALVRRAAHKDPAQRHPTAAAFRYELNAVMGMLGITRRASKLSTDAAFNAVFTQSRLPQAMASARGCIEQANAAFRALVPDLEALVAREPRLACALVDAHERDQPIPCRVRISRRGVEHELLVVVAAAGDHVHLVVVAGT